MLKYDSYMIVYEKSQIRVNNFNDARSKFKDCFPHMMAIMIMKIVKELQQKKTYWSTEDLVEVVVKQVVHYHI